MMIPCETPPCPQSGGLRADGRENPSPAQAGTVQPYASKGRGRERGLRAGAAERAGVRHACPLSCPPPPLSLLTP